jgi:hypothetical protein
MNKRSAAKASFGTKAKEAAARGRSIQASVDRWKRARRSKNPKMRCRPASANIHPSFRRSISPSRAGKPI